MSRLAGVFRRARAENRAAFIAYLTAGDPNGNATVAMARALDGAGADVLELGVPFSDPIADGPAIQRASARALRAGTSLDTVWRIARRIRASTGLALVLFSYANPLLRRGIDRTAAEARDAGFDGVLVTDLPPEEARGIQPTFAAAGLDTIFLVSPTSTRARMAAAARLSSGFLYVVSRTGPTGPRDRLASGLGRTVSRARKAAKKLPIAIGFGIATPEAAAEAARLADGIVVGSALVGEAERAGNDRAAAVGALTRRLVLACLRSPAKRGSPVVRSRRAS